MAEYISREDAEKALLERCKETGYGGLTPDDIRLVMRTSWRIPAADVRHVVLCKDCVYWQKPQVRLNDGTYRDYEPGEYENGSFFGGVTSDVGINIGSFCAKYNTEHQNRIPQFMGENDFCSKGYKLREES